MGQPNLQTALGFSRPGGETCGTRPPKPIDFEHLDRQTFCNRDLAAEVLQLFSTQISQFRRSFFNADRRERSILAHALKGAARNVGAFAIAELAATIEKGKADEQIEHRLFEAFEEFRDYAATICR